MFRILEEREDSYIIEDKDGNVSHQNKTMYFELKYIKFGGERIMHDFGDGLRVEETYDDAIFNSYNGEKTIQISDGEAMAEAILNDDSAKYEKIFDEWYNVAVQTESIKTLFQMYPHRIDLKSEPGHYIIDNVFMVDEHGKANMRDESGDWRFLCIVASGCDNGWNISIPGMGRTDLSSLTMVIIAKIMFLLYPNSRDGVFMGQLSPELKQHVLSTEKRNTPDDI